MYRLYPLIIGVQAFCLYHAYTNKTEQKWFWIILFFPLVGCVFYLYHHFYSRKKIDNVKEGLKSTFVNNYKLNKLEDQVKFADTDANRIALAQEHINTGNYERAIEVLSKSYIGENENDLTLNTMLLQAHYLNENYSSAALYGDKIKANKEFVNSKEMIAYAWSAYKLGNQAKAESIFEQMDIKYCNYVHRLEYVYFLDESDNRELASNKIEELMAEVSSMDAYERKINREEIRDIKALYKKL